jgi:hypothetical protein
MVIGKILKVSLLVGMLMSLVFPVTVIAATQGTEAHQSPDQPEISILSTTTDTIDLIVRFPAGPIQNPSAENSVIFNEAFYDHPSDSGVPDLPVLYNEIEIPSGETVEIQILDSKSYTENLGDDNLPASIPERAPDVEKCSSEALCSIVTPSLLQQTSDVFPEAVAKLIGTYIMRGHQVAQLEFWPVQYDPANQTVEIYQEITLRILISGADSQASAPGSNIASQAFENLLSGSVLNYTPQVVVQTDRSTGGEGYLIVAPDAFISTLGTLVDLKESQGYSVTVAGLSTTGTSAENIQSYIQNAYDNWSIPPTYVLLVGDVDNGSNSIPAFTGNSTSTVTDLYYGTVDGSDWIPDVFVGRLPARSTSQLSTMISNLVAYNNLTGTESWVRKAALLASNDPTYWTVAEGTQNYVILNDTQPAGYTGTFPSNPQAGGDKLYAYSYSANTSNVLSAINNGRSLIAYSGHGSSVSWGGPSFSESNIRSISSTGTFSVVASFACYTGKFDTTESFGETWLLQSNKGAVAFIGSSSSTFWGPDDAMERAMMDSLYSGTQSANVVGLFKFAGLMEIEATRSGTGTAQSRYYWESYNTFGDPALELLIGPKESDFTLSVEPSTISVCQNDQSTATIGVGQTNGFSDPVSIAVSGVPSNVTADLSVNPVNPPNTSQLTFSANNHATVGDYSLVVSGTSGSLYHEYSLGLSVFSGVPSSVTLTSPANGATNVNIDTFLNWYETQTSLTYEIQIALDSNFTQIVYSQTGLGQPSFDPSSSLANSTTYYWRVRATNACGTSSYSTTYSFTTAAAPGDCPSGTAPIEIYQTDFTNTSGWSHDGTNDTWVKSSSRSYSPSYSYHSVDKNAVSIQHLTSPTFTVPETYGEPVTLKFLQWYDIESNSTGCFDGAILEISNNGGQSWSQVPNNLLLTNPYVGAISSSYGNPLGGSMGWCGLQDWSETVVDLSDYAGQSVKLRFSQGTDASLGLEGWYVDDFSLVACETKPDYRPYLNSDNISTGQAPGQDVTVNIKLTNAGLNTDTYTVDLSNSSWSVDLKTRDVITLQPGESTTLEVTVTIPADAAFGEVEEIVLSVISQNDPENPPATDQTTIKLMAAILSFVPMVNTP